MLLIESKDLFEELGNIVNPVLNKQEEIWEENEG
jgi:hypothetical protein